MRDDDYPSFTDLRHAVREAKRREQEGGRPQYVAYPPIAKQYVITTSMPLMGEWYDSNGVRHG